jgi:hypothetical protein
MARYTAAMLALWLAPALVASAPVPSGVRDALAEERLGLFPGREYRLTGGRCSDCPAPRQALWYFEDDLVAVPRDTGGHRPSLVWVGAPDLLSGVRLAPGGGAVEREGTTLPLELAPRLRTNRSYYDATSAAFFSRRPLRIRGRCEDSRFVARQIWPEDYRLAGPQLDTRPLSSGDSMASLITARGGGVRAPFEARVLWRRPGSTPDLAGQSVLALVLSGAQGDDDEAHGGHFAIATGGVGPKGEWHDWMVNNFYNLDFVSEKGIVAARVPMDHYLMDLNSGQSYYRPVYVLALVLRQPQAARRYQDAIDPVYDRLYRHEFQYHHAALNCTGISMDALRGCGWKIPRKGPTSRTKATAAFFYMWAKERSLSKGESTFDYLSEEQTRLLPRAAFEAAGNDVLRMARGTPGRVPTEYERALAEDLTAVVFMRVPQIPSSRAWGQYPIGSFSEYQRRVPSDTSKWKIVSVDARPFPESLRDTPAPPPHHSRAPLYGALTVGGAGTGLAATAYGVRRWRARVRARRAA